MNNRSSWIASIVALLFLVCATSVDAAPTLYLQQQLISGGSANSDVFGNAVAVSGTIALVAANNQTVNGNAKQGAVYVYTYADGNWTLTATLTATDGAAADYFGTSVSLSGSTALIGAPYHGGSGAAYVFTESGGTWTQAAELTASDGVSGDNYGMNVAIDGSTAVIGAPGKNGSQGGAYVYAEPGGGWASTSAFTAELTASDGAAMDEFGFSVSVSGDTVVAGAPEHQVGANSQQGSVYVFTKPGSGWATTSAFDAELTSSDGAARDQFGYAVAAAGSTILVGAPDHVPSTVKMGAAYVYTEPASGWATTSDQAIELTPPDGVDSGLFGNAVALIGGEALVGSKWATAGGDTQQGAAYLYVESTGGWAAGVANPTEFTAEDAVAQAAFGYSIALDSSAVLVGAPHYIDSIQTVPGEAYAFSTSDVSIEYSETGHVAQGDNYTITATVLNQGSSTSPPVTLSIAIPSGTKFVSVSSDFGTCTQESAAELCDIGNLPANTQVNVNLTLQATGAVGSTLATSVRLVGSAPEETLGDDSTDAVIITTATSSSGSGSGSTNSGSTSSGGGGAFGVLLLITLLGIRIVKRKVY